MDDPKVINLSDSIDKTIEGVNKFYALIDIARVNEEKLNNKFYRNFLGFSLCCLKKWYKNNIYINEKINEINQTKEEINQILIKIRDNYMEENISTTLNIRSQITCEIALFIIISIFHYLAMTEVEGLLFSLFGEIKKIITFWAKDKYTTNKTFYDFLKNSTLNDTAQINFNYLLSILSPFLIKNNRLFKSYLFSILLIFICFLICWSVNFLDEEQLKENTPYDSKTIILLIIIYIILYLFASLISLIPHKIIITNKNFTWGYLFLINLSLTLGVIFKNIINYCNEISSILTCGIIFLCSSFIFLISGSLIGYCMKKYNNDNNNDLRNYNNGFENNPKNINIFHYDKKLLDAPINNSEEIVEIINNKINLFSEGKKFYASDYYFWYLTISFDEFIFIIKIKSFCSFLS